MVQRLPIQLTRFVGREREIAAVRRLLAETRLLTLTGAGGSGKTRLANEVAKGLGQAYEEGVYWIELAAIGEASLVPRAVARVLGVPEQQARSVREVLAEQLRDAQLLLILDNCEHLIAACAELVHFLLHACPRVHFLATSREPLALEGERIYPVPPLSVPSAALLAELGSTATVSQDVLAQLRRCEGVNLFLERAAAVVPNFRLTPGNAGAIGVICRRLDGIPLAIELAAARVNVLTVEQIAGRLDERFTLLTSRQRVEQIQRHQTLRAAIDWSYALLTLAEKALFRRLSVFVGGCSLATAEAVCTRQGVEREQLLALLSSLVDKSLVVAETLQAEDARYRMLETIREYAAAKLKDAGEERRMRDRHLRCFLDLAEETEPKLAGEFQPRWLNRLEGEVGNIRAALSWTLESDRAAAGEPIEAGLRIASALYQFWTIRDFREEGLRWFERLMARAPEGISPVVRLNALVYASLMASFHGRTRLQMQYAAEAAAVSEEVDPEDKQALATALGARAFAARRAGDAQSAYRVGRQAIELLRELDDAYELGLGLTIYSFLAMSVGAYAEARAMLDEGLPLLRKAGSPYRIAMALNFKGDLARCEEKYAEAVAAYGESSALLREIEADRDLASVLHNQGHATLQLGEVEHARALFRESMTIHREQENRMGMAESLLGFAALAIAREGHGAGARLLAAAEAIGGRQVTSEWAATRLAYEALLARARAGLTENVFRAEQEAGRRMSLEEAVADALETAERGAARAAARAELDGLTPREREVAMLVARPMSNGEIAEALVLSKRTVETHVSHILDKLGFESRTEIVRWAFEAGLVDASE